MNAMKNYHIVKVIDNFDQYLSGFNALDMNDTVILEGTQDGKRVTQGVLVSDLLVNDEYSGLGSPSQRLNLLKGKSRSSVSVNNYRSKEDTSCRLQPEDKVTVSRWEAGSSTPTVMEVSAVQFVNADGFDAFGTNHQRLDLMRTMAGNKTCGEHWDEIPTLRIFRWGDDQPSQITAGQVISPAPIISPRIDETIQRLKEAKQIENAPLPTKGLVTIHRKYITDRNHRDHNEVLSQITITFQGPADKEGMGPKAFQITIRQDPKGMALSLTVENTIHGKTFKEVMVKEHELTERGLDLSALEEDGTKPLPPEMTRYFWNLILEQYGVQRY